MEDDTKIRNILIALVITVAIAYVGLFFIFKSRQATKTTTTTQETASSTQATTPAINPTTTEKSTEPSVVVTGPARGTEYGFGHRVEIQIPNSTSTITLFVDNPNWKIGTTSKNSAGEIDVALESPDGSYIEVEKVAGTIDSTLPSKTKTDLLTKLTKSSIESIRTKTFGPACGTTRANADTLDETENSQTFQVFFPDCKKGEGVPAYVIQKNILGKNSLTIIVAGINNANPVLWRELMSHAEIIE